MEWLSSLVDVIILVGALVLAIERICNWLGKPIKIFRKKGEKGFEERVKTIVTEMLPPILKAHDLETRDKYKSDRENYLQEIKAEVLKSIQQELVQVATLAEQYEALVISAKDVLREKIMGIYHKNKKDKHLTLNEKEALDQYYMDYKAMKGNSYIDKYYARMKTWKVLDDDYDDE